MYKPNFFCLTREFKAVNVVKQVKLYWTGRKMFKERKQTKQTNKIIKIKFHWAGVNMSRKQWQVV
jgi:hypothetical protein